MQLPNLVNNDSLIWSDFAQPLVRDLAWSVFSPSLIKPGCSRYEPDSKEVSRQDLDTLVRLDRDVTPLQDWMAACPSRRLGFRFEHLWKYWWSLPGADEQVEWLYNLQLNLNGKTTGELDAVCWYPQQRKVLHTELAVKFYLGIDNNKLPFDRRSEDAYCWVGPNIQDRLDLKWHQLEQQQLTRLLDSESQALLPDHWHWEQLQTQAIVRGRLFYPLSGLLAQSPLPAAPHYLNPNHLSGLWLSMCEVLERPLLTDFRSLDLLDHNGVYGWVVLNRQQWFAPIVQQGEQQFPLRDGLPVDQGELARQVQHHFASHRQPLQIALLQATTDAWHERIRCFVVPDYWPGTTCP